MAVVRPHFSAKIWQRGFEPDECFYIQHAELVRGKKQIDLAEDPPSYYRNRHHRPVVDPSSLALGILEVWRHDGARVAIFGLVDSCYVERAESVFLPKVTSAILTELIDASTQ